MSDQYLWDKSGAPDAEIEKLERLLGSLRYRLSENDYAPPFEATRAAALPLATQHIAVQAIANSRRVTRFPLPAVAIAAMTLLAIVAGGLWIKMRAPESIKTDETQLVATTILPPDSAPKIRSNYPAVDFSANVAAAENDSPKHAQTFASSHKKQSNAVFERRSQPAPHRIANSLRSGKNNDALTVEGERAKKQLVLALYIASEKLNFAQKKIQVNKDSVPAS